MMIPAVKELIGIVCHGRHDHRFVPLFTSGFLGTRLLDSSIRSSRTLNKRLYQHRIKAFAISQTINVRPFFKVTVCFFYNTHGSWD
jgi:hypothetical protein